ncbi:hypothetical protein LX88_001184 [Lentzea californiensis]|nr:hypothetical protein [Lentzea californiensis]
MHRVSARTWGASSRQDRFAAMVGRLQVVDTYTVMVDGGGLVSFELTQAQAEGFECLTCKRLCGNGLSAFKPVGFIPSTGMVFRCVSCLDGAA